MKSSGSMKSNGSMPILGNFKSSRSTIRLRNLVQVAVGQEWAIFKPIRSMTRLRNLSQVALWQDQK